jgi:ATP-dependent DNA ligase
VRRAELEQALAAATPPIHVTPATRDRAIAADWFTRFEGAGLDGVIAKPLDVRYVEDKREMVKVKHQRTADVVVAGYRTHKDGKGVGSLMIGLYDASGTLQHTGVASGFSVKDRAEIAKKLEPLRENALEQHPWKEWAHAESHEAQRMPGAQSRWNNKRDLSWNPIRVELVAEVAYDHLQGSRFRHATKLLRWRPDRTPQSCTYAQLDAVAPEELSRVFATR